MRDNGGTQSSGQKEEPEGFVRWNEQRREKHSSGQTAGREKVICRGY